MSTLSERLRAYCIDFDGSQMKDLASPLDGMTCGEVREAADELDRLTEEAAERARADALEAALSDVLEMAQEHADYFAAAFAGYKPERHAYYARALAAARALLEKKT